MTTFHINSVKDINTSLLQSIKRMFQGQSMTIKIEVNQENMPDFKLSLEQKQILDSQKDLPLSDYQDGNDMVKELKSNYGIPN